MPFARTLIVVAALVLPWLPPVPAPALAEADDAPIVLIIDMDKIRREASAFQSLQRQIDERRTSYQGELQRKEQELRRADQELANQRTILSADAFAQKRKELEQRAAGLQQEVQQRRVAMENLFKLGMTELQKSLIEIVGDIANERSADLVLSKAMVVLVKPEMEITDQALQQLNARLPSVSLKELQN